MHLGRKEYLDDFSAALQIAPVDTPAVRIPILLAAARCMPVVALERSYAEEALALARQSGNEVNEADALMTLAMFQAGAGQSAGAGSGPVELIAQARAMAVRAGAHSQVAKAAVNASHLLEGAGEHELAFEEARRGIAGQDEYYIGLASRSLLAINQMEPLFALGRWDEALEVARAAREFQFTSLPLHRATLAVLAGHIMLARGRRGRRGSGRGGGRAAAQLGVCGRAPASAGPAGDLAAAGHGRAGRRGGDRVAGHRGLTSCPVAARGTRGRCWRVRPASAWWRPGTSGCATRPPRWRAGCARSRRSWRRSARLSRPAG